MKNGLDVLFDGFGSALIKFDEQFVVLVPVRNLRFSSKDYVAFRDDGNRTRNFKVKEDNFIHIVKYRSENGEGSVNYERLTKNNYNDRYKDDFAND